MNQLAIKGIEILDADVDFIEYNLRGKNYRVEVDIDGYLKDSGLLDCSEDKWNYSTGHYTNDWKITPSDYLQDVSIYDVASDYIRDNYPSLEVLINVSTLDDE